VWLGGPIVHYAVENIAAADISEIEIVVSPVTRRDVQASLNGYGDAI